MRHASTLFSHLLREGAAAVRTQLVTARSAWIEYESENDLNVNLDGEPMLVKQFRVECRLRVLPVHLGDSPLISSH
jgi:diacylglycerol kinase family enzyme